MTAPTHISVLRLLLVLSVLFNGTLSFYIISSNSCKLCLERIAVAQELYPRSVFVNYDIAEGDSLRRFDEISGIIDEAFLPLPVFGVFEDDRLRAIVAGGPSADAWKRIIGEDMEGVPVYVDDGTGRAELKKTIENVEKVANLEKFFTEIDIEVYLGDFNLLILPISIAAAIDAVNPCSISVFIVLLAFVFHSTGRGVALRTGLSFSFAVFITYFLIGLGLIRAFGGLSKIRTFGDLSQIKYIVVFFALFLGVMRIIEFLTGERRHLPNAFITQITKYLERASNPLTGFVAGVVSASLLLPCSSAPYFLALNLLSNKATLLGGVLLLMIYNLIIITPFLIITVCVHSLGVKTLDLKLWIEGRRRWINLLVGLGLICLSILMLYVMG